MDFKKIRRKSSGFQEDLKEIKWISKRFKENQIDLKKIFKKSNGFEED